MVESKAKCPKCKSTHLILTEVWKGHTIEWEQIDGKFDRSEGYLEPGEPAYVEAHCYDCRYGWRFRKITQIDGLIK